MKKQKLIAEAGVNWAHVYTINNSDFKFIEGRFAIFIASADNRFCSIDGGKSWQSRGVFAAPLGLGCKLLQPKAIGKHQNYNLIAIGKGYDSAPSKFIYFIDTEESITTSETWNTETTDLVRTKAPDAFSFIFCTPTGRLIVGQYNSTTLLYSDDGGTNWTEHNIHTSWGGAYPTTYCVTPTGRLIIGGNALNMVYSDDDGDTWYEIYGGDAWECGEGTYTGALCVTPTGRILRGDNASSGIAYSDDNGITWAQSDFKNGDVVKLISTPTGKIYAVMSDYDSDKILLSNDNGEHWTVLSDTLDRITDLCVTATDALIKSDSTGIWYSEPVYEPEYTSKPLTGKQAKELVQQCKAYVQSLKNGN